MTFDAHKPNHKPTEGERICWMTVLGWAFYDGTKPRATQYDQDYIFVGNYDYYEVCDHAGVCPFYVRRKAKQAIAGEVSPKLFLKAARQERRKYKPVFFTAHKNMKPRGKACRT